MKTISWLVTVALALWLCPARASAQQESAAKVVAQSNNPLSDLIGFNVNEYYAPSLYASDAVSNVMNLQGVLIPTHRFLRLSHLVRATLPVATVPSTPTSYASGLGDFVIQDAFKFSKEDAKTQFGIGPLLVIPTATDDALGAGKWQAGAAFVLVHLIDGGSVLGVTGTWQTDFAGDKDRPPTNLATVQTDMALAMGTSGWYISSSPISTFDFENDRYLIPFSLGVGKVFMTGKTIVNVTAEPQITVYHKGEQQPTTQLFLGLTLQRKRVPKSG
jgi:hypothetical protein